MEVDNDIMDSAKKRRRKAPEEVPLPLQISEPSLQRLPSSLDLDADAVAKAAQ